MIDKQELKDVVKEAAKEIAQEDKREKRIKYQPDDKVAPTILPNMKEKIRAQMRKEREKDAEMVRGKFIFNEVPGGVLSFSFKKYDGDPVKRYEMVDGCIYTIPRAVARHLNNNCSYPIHSYYSKEDNKGTLMRIGQVVHRTTFQSLEFMDDTEDRQVPLVTVEQVPMGLA